MKEEIAYREPNLELLNLVANKIYDSLYGEEVEKLMGRIGEGINTHRLKSLMEGSSLKVQKELLPEFHDLCQGVLNALDFREPVDFYIVSDGEINASALLSEYSDSPHVVMINSALFNLLENDELRFVVGHEIGHLISRDSHLQAIWDFIFDEDDPTPLALEHSKRLYNNLCELVADRYGYLACRNLDACITAMFKLASGIDLKNLNVSVDALIKDTSRRMDYFRKDSVILHGTHPLHPFRVEALRLFAAEPSERKFNQGMKEIENLIYNVGTDEFDYVITLFIASAGILAAEVDGKMTKEELTYITRMLETANVHAESIFKEVKKEDIEEVFFNSAASLLEQRPNYLPNMIRYMIEVMISDKKLNDQEIDLLMKVGKELGASEEMIARMVAKGIMESFHYVF